MKSFYFNKTAAALLFIGVFPALSFAQQTSFAKDSWQAIVLKDAKEVRRKQEPIIKKEEELKQALAIKEKKNAASLKYIAEQYKAKPNDTIKTPFQSKMERELIFNNMVSDKYSGEEILDEAKKIITVREEMQKALNAVPLFEYFHLDRNVLSDFSAVTPQGIAFVKEVFKSLQEGREPKIKPYLAELYPSGAVVVYFKGIEGEPNPIALEFYTKQTVVVFILGSPRRPYAELERQPKIIKI